MSRLSNKVQDILKTLSTAEKDQLYRFLWSEHVEEDVRSRLEDNPVEDMFEEDIESLVSNVTERYVYEGRYDCNLSYWDNIQNLIDEEAIPFRYQYQEMNKKKA